MATRSQRAGLLKRARRAGLLKQVRPILPEAAGSGLVPGGDMLDGSALTALRGPRAGLAAFLASDMLNVCCARQPHDPRFTVTDPAARGIRLQPDDDVAIITGDATAGTAVDIGGDQILLRDDVPRGHKLAVRDIRAGDPVRRYGQVIGFAQAAIAAGEHVHLHNVEYREFGREYEFSSDARPQDVLPEAEQATFQGYVRSDGTVGTRNFLGILTTVNCSATAARQIANRMRFPGILDDYENVDGVVALTHGLGCGMAPSGEGIDVLRRVMRGYLAHPNFAGFLILGLGCEDNQVKALTEGLRLRPDLQISTGTIQEIGGTKKTVAAGIERLTAMLPAADKARRETVPASKLMLGTNCGGSDGNSGVTANPALGVAVRPARRARAAPASSARPRRSTAPSTC